ncbi:nickel/cobalt transporter [Streptomyces sp. NPDC002596]
MAVFVGACLAVVLGPGTPASAHPFTNFSTNQYSGLRIGPDAVTVDYVLELAELPARQERTNKVDADRDGKVTAAEKQQYAAATCATIAYTQELRRDGQQIALAVTASGVTFPPGTGGLTTLRLECRLRAPLSLGADSLVEYTGTAYGDQSGWNEVTAVADGVTFASSDVPAASVSRRLTAYPASMLKSPPNVRTARLAVRAGGPPASPEADQPPAAGASGSNSARSRDADRFTLALTDFIGATRLTVGIGLAAVALSLVLGAAHAFTPGHGKTVMAAFLVGERGSMRQAAVVALTVTLTHTAGVLVLGFVLTTSLAFAPEKVYGWLGAVSGMLVAAVGVVLLRRAWLRRSGDGHADHHHRGHTHDHHHDRHGAALAVAAAPSGPLRLRGLVAMGFANGLLPSPSAIVVLLGAAALGRTWFGVLLVVGYGVGMAAVLCGIGLALARWRDSVERRTTGHLVWMLRRIAPPATAGLIVVVGLGLAVRAAALLLLLP